MNSTNISSSGSTDELTDPRSDAAVMLQSASMAIMIIAATGGNLLILAAIYIDKTLQTLTNAFIVNLACADFLLASLGMPFTLVSSITYEWIFGDAWCVINGMANSLFCIASILTLAAVSVDRYVAIIHPFRYSIWMTRNTVTAMIVYIWTHSFVIAILPAAGWSNYTFLKMESICTVQWNGSVAFTVFLFSVCFVVPLAVIMFTYYKIFKTANKQSKRIVPVTGKIVAPAEQDDDEISSLECSTHRQGCSSTNNGTEHTKWSGNRTVPSALEVNGMDSTDTNPPSKDSGFEDSHSLSMPSVVVTRQTSDQPRELDAQLVQGNVSDITVVLAVATPTPGQADIKTCNQGTTSTEETPAQSESESTSSQSKDEDSAGDSLINVPTWYVENTRAGAHGRVITNTRTKAFKNPNDCSHSTQEESGDIGLLPAIIQRDAVQSRTSIVSEKGRTGSQDEQFCDDSAKDTTDRHRLVREGYEKTPGPIPTIVSPSNAEPSRASQGQQRNKKRAGRKNSSSVFSIRDAHLLNPTLAVLGHKSAALLRSHKKSSEYRSKMKRDRKAAKTIVIVLGTFIMLWSPHFIGIFCLLIDGCSWPDEFYAATTWLAMLNSACNPIIYGVMSRQFRKRFFQILRCKRGFF